MKFGAVAAVLLVSLIASSMAVPAHKRMAYYHQQPSYYYQAQMLPQRMMYVQQSSPLTHARSTAFVAGDSVSAGSVLKDCIHPEDVASVEQQAAEASLDQGYPAAGGQVSAEFEGTFAGGYAPAPQEPEVPELPQAPAVENQVLEDAPAPVVPEAAPAAADLPSDNEAKVPREYNFEKPAEAEPEQPAVDSQVAEEAVPEAVPAVPEVPEVPEIPSANPEQAPEAPEAPAAPEVPEAPVAAAPAEIPLAAAPAPVVPVAAPAATPVAPPKRYLPPRKKVIVKLDEQSEAAADDDDDDVDSYRPARIPNARRPIKGNASKAPAKPAAKAPLPVGSFFPINFGGTSGGAIAIANSFSTGEGGSATSHAIAYGSPEAARAKAHPARRH
ncbi:uncharacterized protein LOC129939359 [Eupeodes corollae]|uniref:uncharacterized protein LOC129939359 n=1 Tax=Eupeodes corollae TaxID=290404 RepID=UPI00248F623A|nr:uncharacterized protein LOC129939359 [Eupeodes corollae]